MLKQIAGMLGAIIGLAVVLNVCNRMSNIRKKRKLKRSIFTLPVYVYTASSPSLSRQRENARRQAREQGEDIATKSSRNVPSESPPLHAESLPPSCRSQSRGRCLCRCLTPVVWCISLFSHHLSVYQRGVVVSGSVQPCCLKSRSVRCAAPHTTS